VAVRAAPRPRQRRWRQIVALGRRWSSPASPPAGTGRPAYAAGPAIAFVVVDFVRNAGESGSLVIWPLVLLIGGAVLAGAGFAGAAAGPPAPAAADAAGPVRERWVGRSRAVGSRGSRSVIAQGEPAHVFIPVGP
jgi:hypothetical protein